jgi:DNA-binding response OmpR family regulator
MSRILIVEDEPTIALALQDDLELEGYEVEAVSDGETGERKAREGGFDVILLDVMLPGKDGFSVCRSLRKHGLRTPILLLTARATEADKITGLDLGADDYVTKPFSPGELAARIRSLLRRGATQTDGPGEAAAIHCFGRLTVDLERMEVCRGDEPVELTAQEFRLLRVFLQNPGKVMSLDELLARGWGKDVVLTDRVVYTHVNNLRSKIEDDPSKPKHLLSVRGLGYRFDR